MGDWPVLYDAGPWEAAGIVAASSRGTVVTAAATANTKGLTWTQLIAATARPAAGLFLVELAGTGGASYLVDIAIGAAGFEVLIAKNLLVAHAGTTPGYAFLPIAIPAGSRVSARCASSTASATVEISAILMAQGFAASASYANMTAYGVVAGTSRGTSVDPGATLNTKGAWAQLIASSTQSMEAAMFAIGHQTNITRVGANHLFDIGVGPAGQERIVLPDIFFRQSSNSFAPPWIGALPLSIPVGSRIAVRGASGINDATDRLFDFILYGLS